MVTGKRNVNLNWCKPKSKCIGSDNLKAQKLFDCSYSLIWVIKECHQESASVHLLILPLCISFDPRKICSTWWCIEGPKTTHRFDDWFARRTYKSQHMVVLKAMIYHSKQIYSKISKEKIHMKKFPKKTGLMFPRVLSQWNHTGCTWFLQQVVMIHVKRCSLET